MKQPTPSIPDPSRNGKPDTLDASVLTALLSNDITWIVDREDLCARMRTSGFPTTWIEAGQRLTKWLIRHVKRVVVLQWPGPEGTAFGLQVRDQLEAIKWKGELIRGLFPDPFFDMAVIEHEIAGERFAAFIATLAATGIQEQLPRRQRINSAKAGRGTPRGAERPTPLSDQYNAEAFVRDHGKDFRYCKLWSTWLVWAGPDWQRDDTGETMRRAKRTVKRLGGAMEDLDDAEVKALLSHIKSSLSGHRLKAMVELATSEPTIPVRPDDLDRDPWLLNVDNGTIDLQTGELRPHRREDLITKLAPVEYDPEATCPRWERFLHEIFQEDKELIAFVQRAVGYSITGDTRERALFICYGMGRNGKSTFLETLAEMLGDYAQRTPTRTLMEKRNPDHIPNDVAALKGMRFVHASETGEGKRLDEEFIKDVTGRDTLAARFLHGEWFNFRPQCKLWLRTNHKPVIRGTDPAIWDRPRLIPFLARFNGGNNDKTLADTLRTELSGILRWAVKGCLLWQINGLGSAQAVEHATEAYRQEMDVIGDFIADCCMSLPAASVTSQALIKAYTNWCEQNGEKALTSKALAGRLRERGYLPEKGTHGARIWKGLGLSRPADEK